MPFESVLITGGAGFVGSNLAVHFRHALPQLTVTAVDNLKRRGSELNLPRLRRAGVRFLHADVRSPEDLAALPEFDLLLDCSAEPSVHAGNNDSPRYVLNTNLMGTVNCLELAQQRDAAVLFLSTSRVYPIGRLNALDYEETETRFTWRIDGNAGGVSLHGVAEGFPLTGARSFYGASKLASELLIQEYCLCSGMKAIINRCGIITGPWQMGKVDQGVVALWVARHYFQQPLVYTGFGGSGKQVRDVLHVRDLFEFIRKQMDAPQLWDGRVYNVGGGREGSLSLRELTAACEEVTGNRITIGSNPRTTPMDVRIFLADSRRARRDFHWQPQATPTAIVSDIHEWIRRHEADLKPVFEFRQV